MKVQFSLRFYLILIALMSCGNFPQTINKNIYSSTFKYFTEETLYAEKQDDKFKMELDKYETLNGWLTKNVPEKIIIDSLGNPEVKGEDVFWEGTANYVQKWEYGSLGLILFMESDELGNDKKVFHIEIHSPSLFKTSKGTGIGSSKKDVLVSYANVINKNESDSDVIVIGSVYGGTCFYMVNEQVSSIFIGELAE